MNNFNESKISIIIINYNWLNYLKRSINNILELNYENKEIIIVDNWSNDWSIEYIKSFKEIILVQSPRIREKNFACNLWVTNSTGEYILMLDNDILFTDKNILTDLINTYNSKNNIWCLWLSFTNEWEDKSKWYWNYLSYYYSTEKKSLNINELKQCHLSKIWFPSWALFFIKKDIWNNIWGYDDNLKFWWDDSDLWIKLWIMWYENYLYSKSIQTHIWMPERSDNKKFQIKFKEMFFADMYTIVKNFKSLNMIVTLLIYSLYYLLRAIKQSIFRLNIWPFLAYFWWYYLFIKNLNTALQKRKIIQSKRIIKDDIFLKIH